MGLNLLGLPRKFDPRRVSPGNLKLWLDATRITGLNDGDAVGTWSDVSGNGNDATQATASAKPTYKVNIQNSRPVVRFASASSQYLNANGLASIFSGTDKAITAFAVFKVTGTGTMRIFNATRSTNANPFFDVFRTASGVFNVSRRDDAGTVPSVSFGVVANDTFYVASHKFTGTASTFKVDGSAWINGYTMDVGAMTVNQVSIGAWIANTAGSSFFDGDLCELLVYSGADMTLAQERRILHYLARKWGISLVRQVVGDSFTRADNALTLGNAETGQTWTAQNGTWGISSNKAYNASDAHNSVATIESGEADGIVACVVRGELVAPGISAGSVIARFNDTSNYLEISLHSGAAQLWKLDGGAATALATTAITTSDSTDYTIRVDMSGNTVLVYVDGTLRITHTLSGGDTKYAAYTSHGIRHVRSGSPATAATWDQFAVEV